jgi:N-acetylglucosamine kinase-like BadF-type ATPase
MIAEDEMATYVSVDAGGTKCLAVMFDEKFNVLGRGRSGGVNTNTTTLEDCRKNVAECLDQLMSLHHPSEIDRVLAVFIGPRQVLKEQLEARSSVREFTLMGEGQAGLLAGSMRRSGLVALSGTGSDIFLVRGGQRESTLGGWGPILGDYGSGTWIGHRALQAAVKSHEGWGEHTVLFDMVMEDWKLSKGWDIVTVVYGAESPFRKVASVTPLVGKAARQGDPVALGIVREAGAHMAEQTEGLIRREAIPQNERGRRTLICTKRSSRRWTRAS